MSIWSAFAQPFPGLAQPILPVLEQPIIVMLRTDANLLKPTPGINVSKHHWKKVFGRLSGSHMLAPAGCRRTVFHLYVTQDRYSVFHGKRMTSREQAPGTSLRNQLFAQPDQKNASKVNRVSGKSSDSKNSYGDDS
jgi:hypothetical protein